MRLHKPGRRRILGSPVWQSRTAQPWYWSSADQAEPHACRGHRQPTFEMKAVSVSPNPATWSSRPDVPRSASGRTRAATFAPTIGVSSLTAAMS